MSQPKTHYLLRAASETPWAILPHKLVTLQEIIERHIAGEKLTAEEIEARVHGAKRPEDKQVQGVAVLPLFGTIFPRANLMTEMSGATSAEMFGRSFDALLDNPGISAIVLDINSPGGQVGGVEELSHKIYSARGRKPVVSVVNHMMASAAYWIGTSADEVVVTPSGEVGSIGVFAMHVDYSAQLAMDGIKVSFISQGKHKVEGNPYEPLGESARANIQEDVDLCYEKFVNAVARNRSVSVDVVQSDFGQGRMLNAHRAVSIGMADRIGTLDETVKSLLANTYPSTVSTAASALVNQTVNVPTALLPQSDEVETQTETEQPSEQPPAGPDPRKVESLRNYLKVYKTKKEK